MRRSIARVLADAERAGCDAESCGGPQSVIPSLIIQKLGLDLRAFKRGSAALVFSGHHTYSFAVGMAQRSLRNGC